MQQALANGLVSAATIMLVALGFGLIWRCGRCLHFAHGVVFATGPYCAYAITAFAGFPLGAALPIGVLCGSVLGCAVEVLVYRPLRTRQAPSLVLLVASIGTYIVLQNVIALVFGNDAKVLYPGLVAGGLDILGAKLTPIQVVIIVVGVGLSVIVTLLLRSLKLGRGIRAVASDPELAAVSGVPDGRIILWTFAIGSALASTAGILSALDVSMRPTMGLRALMLAMVAAIVGGVANPGGTLLGALLLGLTLHVGVLRINAAWQDAIAFLILLVFLVVRPEGIRGKKLRKARA